MNKEVYEIDEDGFKISEHLVEFDGETPVSIVLYSGKISSLTELPDNYIATPLPQPNFHRPKWTNTKWVEGFTQEEIDEITKPKEAPLTDIEILSQLLTERELELMLQGQQLVAFELKLAELEAKLNV